MYVAIFKNDHVKIEVYWFKIYYIEDDVELRFCSNCDDFVESKNFDVINSCDNDETLEVNFDDEYALIRIEKIEI